MIARRGGRLLAAGIGWWGCWVGLAPGGCAALRPAGPRFSPEAFKSHIEVLAADELEGRGLETQGIDLAAGYIAGQFAAFGVEPGGENGTYFQPFKASVGADLVEADTRLAFGGATVTPQLREDYVPFAFSSGEAFDAPVVFAGYGIVNPDKQYDDYAALDVNGKVVLILRREPSKWGDDAGGPPTTLRASFQAKAYEAKNRGAAAILVVNKKPEGSEEDRLTRFGRMGSEAYGLPAMHITRATADKLLAAGGHSSLDVLEKRLEDEGSVCSAALNGVTASGKAGVTTKQVTARNVIGVVHGQGPLAGEYIVIGGHYDHLGIARERAGFGGRRAASQPAGERRGRDDDSAAPQIHNGADDNASGTSGVIELAKAFAKRMDLKRSFIFMAFTGEESGLYGSKHFVENPTVPLDKIVAMLNMDMIGRLSAESRELQVFGTQAADEFDAVLKKYANHSGFKLKGDASALGPSDHDSFYRKKIPAVHFFTGLHEDYHRPGDDTPKINAQGGADVLGYVYMVADELESLPKRPTYHEVKERAQISGRSGRVAMGIMPSYTDEQSDKGMMVDGVIPEGPAAKAGVKDGDYIVSIDGKAVKNVYDYMGALQNAKPGDLCEVVVQRGEERLPLKVTLVSR